MVYQNLDTSHFFLGMHLGWRSKRSLVGSVHPSASPFIAKVLTSGVLLYAQPRDKVDGVGTHDKRKRHPLD